MIYLDNAATSWPKPPEVLKAMADSLEQAGGNPGRSGHRLSIAAARVIYNAREETARFFGVSDPLRVIVTNNATHAINLALQGILKPGDHVITTSMEHNAVMRPLRHLERQGVRLSIVPCAPNGNLEIANLSKAVNTNTNLIIITHASNVVGTILPVAEIVPRKNSKALAEALRDAILNPPKEKAQAFVREAAERFDVKERARELETVMLGLIKRCG